MVLLTLVGWIALTVLGGAAIGLLIAVIIIFKLEDKGMEKRKKYGNPKNDVRF